MAVADVSALYQQLKLWLIGGTGLSKDALHIYAGLAIFLIVRTLWRGRRRTGAAWTLVLAAALAGEWIDIRGEHLRGALQPDAAHWHDVWNTLFWPSVLALIAWRSERRRAGGGSGEDAERRFEQA